MYEKFKEIDGTHPWRSVSPDGYVDYQARYRPHGRVLYFNFPLAKEMGLIPSDHAVSITKELEQVILDTFSLQIINEYDLERGKKYPPETIKPHPFMATRYLQIQHRNRQGKTSGDGRSIWNGCLKSDNLLFDISSRGTGATILSPGAQEAQRHVATGDYTRTTDTSKSGLEISYWVPRDRPGLARGLGGAADGLDWLERLLGPYPFDSLGFVLVDSRSGMETQTMITLGTTDYTTSPEVIVHEMAHQWYGDEVTPGDWRDVWMNEGMAMYLQWAWQADHAGASLDALLDGFARVEPVLRREAGPPADYDPAAFGRGNIYFGPALMWHELRRDLGDEEFWAGVRAWPDAHENGNASYDDITAWWSERAGRDLSGFFDAWLLAEESPTRG